MRLCDETQRESTDGGSTHSLARLVPIPSSLLVSISPAQACFGGMLFGMDSGIIGGVLTMEPFKVYVLVALSHNGVSNNIPGNMALKG